jgi:hypothetical protein
MRSLGGGGGEHMKSTKQLFYEFGQQANELWQMAESVSPRNRLEPISKQDSPPPQVTHIIYKKPQQNIRFANN